MKITEENLRSYSDWDEQIVDVNIVSEAENDTVYQIKKYTGEIRFVRTITKEKVKIVNNLSTRNECFGLPPYSIVEGEPPLLSMGVAPGFPLSRVLPVLMLPIAWGWKSKNLRVAYKQAGKYLGRLHRETDNGEKSTENTSFDYYCNLDEELEVVLDRETFALLESATSNVQKMDVRCAAIHGDPTPHNIFYQKGDVCFIDFALDDDAVVRDILQFERGIELMVGRLPYAGDSKVSPLIRSFREGYKDEYPDYTRPERTELLESVMDAYLLSLHKRQFFGKRGSLIASRTDVPILISRIEEALL